MGGWCFVVCEWVGGWWVGGCCCEWVGGVLLLMLCYVIDGLIGVAECVCVCVNVTPSVGCVLYLFEFQMYPVCGYI